MDLSEGLPCKGSPMSLNESRSKVSFKMTNLDLAEHLPGISFCVGDTKLCPEYPIELNLFSTYSQFCTLLYNFLAEVRNVQNVLHLKIQKIL